MKSRFAWCRFFMDLRSVVPPTGSNFKSSALEGALGHTKDNGHKNTGVPIFISLNIGFAEAELLFVPFSHGSSVV